MPIQSRPLPNSQFSGFFDDELGKLGNLSASRLERILTASDPYTEFQSEFNRISLDTLNTYLLNVALFADPILVVDGWMLLTPDWWESFERPERNLLPQMLKCGLVRSFARYDGGLGDLIPREAKKNITYDRLLTSDETKERYPVLQKVLGRYDDLDVVRYVKWPLWDMDHLMQTTLDESVLQNRLDVIRGDLGISERGLDRLKAQYAASVAIGLDGKPLNSNRQGWVKAILLCAKSDDFWINGSKKLDSIQSLVSLGVEAYHLSRAIALNGGNSSLSVDVNTLPQKIASQMDSQRPISSLRFLEDGLLSLAMEWSDFPKDKCYKLRDLEDPTSVLGSRKLRFLATREAYITAYQQKEEFAPKLYEVYSIAAADYAAELNSAFSTQVDVTFLGKRTERSYKFFADSVSKGAIKFSSKLAVSFAEAYLGGNWGPEVKAGMEAPLEFFISSKLEKMNFLTRKLDLVVEEQNILNRREFFEDLRVHQEGTPTISPFSVDCAKATGMLRNTRRIDPVTLLPLPPESEAKETSSCQSAPNNEV